MFSVASIAAVVLGYLVLLFFVGFLGDKLFKDNKQHPLIYTLALGVHCTSWAFFGTTTQAAQYGWAFVPTYLGVILVMIFGYSLLKKITFTCHRYNVSSLADFIGLQYQRSHLLAAFVSIICFFGVVPYIALQLDSVSRGLDIVAPNNTVLSTDIGMYVAVVLAAFAILFGTRSYSLTDKHPGLMLTVAFASMIKLFALLAVGLFVCYGLFDGVFDLLGKSQINAYGRSIIQADASVGVYISHMILGVCAMFCLPRQFHITFIENNGEQELHMARWGFPLYLLGMTLFILPIALAGHLILQPENVSTDTYALMLPAHADNKLFTLISFIGGLAAATSMVMVATLAVGIMVSNNLVTPLWLKIQLLGKQQKELKPATLLFIRRFTIALVLAVSYFYHKDVSYGSPLVNSGIIAMALLAQTMPLIIISLYSKQANRHVALCALLVGAIGWFYWLLWPSIKSSYYFDPQLTDIELGRGFILSLLANLVCFALLSFLLPNRQHRSDDPEQTFRDNRHPHAIKVSRLLALTNNMLSLEKQQSIENLVGGNHTDGYANPTLLDTAENEIAGQIGGVSARILMSAIAEKEHVPLPELVEWMEEASQTFQFNHEMLQSSVQHIQQGISVVDRDLQLIAWNQSYVELFDYPQTLIKAGLSMRTLLEFNAQRGLLGAPQNADYEIEKRIAYIQQGSRYKYVRKQLNGKVIELNGSPLPGGGYVTTYSDITEYITIQQELEQAKSHLEQRVEQRTEELKQTNIALSKAKQEAEEANESKTKFLAAAGHDLMQPFNAANLFAELIKQKATDADIKQLSVSLSDSLNSAEELLSLLLDMTKLESGALTPVVQEFNLADVLNPLVGEFSIMAKQKGLTIRHVPCSLAIRSDKKLLRRILQNLLSNAVRYTHQGKILVGCKRRGKQLSIMVADTGEGIAEVNQTLIFEEFHQIRSQTTQQGLGLGLTIVDKITQLLQHPLLLDSTHGKGSTFSISVPLANGHIEAKKANVPEPSFDSILANKTVLLAENEAHTREAVSKLLESWGATIVFVENMQEAMLVKDKIDLMLLDYHLNNGEKGSDIGILIRQMQNQDIPGILNSASRDEEVRKQAVDANLHYLPKPLKPASFKRLLRQWKLI